MKKTDELVRVPHSTMYLPRVYLTNEEIIRSVEGRIAPSVLKIYVINYKDVEEYKKHHKPKLKIKEVIPAFVKQHLNDQNIKKDVILFSKGELDLIDLSVKYGLYYKTLRKTFIQCLPNTDVNSLWNMHKKYIQKRTDMKIYGYKNSALDPIVKAKKDATMLKRYGTTNVMTTTRGVDKIKKTMQQKYGVSFAWEHKQNEKQTRFRKKIFNYLNVDSYWHKTFKYLADKYNCETSYMIFDDHYLQLFHRDFIITEKITNNVEQLLRTYKKVNKIAISYPTDRFFNIFDDYQGQDRFSKTWLRYYSNKNLVLVNNKSVISGSSKYETLMINILTQHCINFEVNKRKILDGIEMDFYFPDQNIGLEINPNCTHNSNKFAINSRRVIHDDSKQIKKRNYHYNKYKRALSKGITLIQWFSPDLAEPTLQNISIPRLLSLVSGYTKQVYGRNVTVEVSNDKKTTRKFINKYHSQGAGSANEYWDFKINNILIAAASFTIKKNQVELKRLCYKPGTQIVGGISKLINHFFKTHQNIDQIISYSDNNLGSGNGYKHAHAKFINETGPSLHYVSWTDPTDNYTWSINTPWGTKNKNGILYKASQGHIFKNQDEIEKYIELKLPHRTDNKSGYDRIYTAGSKKWVFYRSIIMKKN